MRALREQGVVSPMRDCGLTKADIRRLSKQAGLFTHDKPSYACLATRVPTGTAITQELLEKIERAEKALYEMGFTDFRVRIMKQGDGSSASTSAPGSQYIARIQMPESQWNRAASQRKEILEVMRHGFCGAMLDMITR